MVSHPHHGHVYHWKHGWIPLDHTAALSKAKGSTDAAKRMLPTPAASNSPSPSPSPSAAPSKGLPIGGWERHTDALVARGAGTYAKRSEYDAAINKIKALGGEGKGTPYDAHQRYGLGEYGNINGYLQGRAPKNETATVLDIVRLDRAFSEAGDITKGPAVYRRGVRPSPGFNPAEAYKEGSVIQEAGYLSMSTENPQSFRGVDGWTMNILVPAGQKTIPGTYYEKEVILNRGTTHHVVKVDPVTRTIWTQVAE